MSPRETAAYSESSDRYGGGPSELLVICDGGTDPDWVAMIFLARRARRDGAGDPALPGGAFIDKVAASIERQIRTCARRRDRRCARGRGALIETRDLDEACEIANRMPPSTWSCRWKSRSAG